MHGDLESGIIFWEKEKVSIKWWVKVDVECLESWINSVLERQKSKSEKENVVALLTLNWMSENFLLKICAKREGARVRNIDEDWKKGEGTERFQVRERERERERRKQKNREGENECWELCFMYADTRQKGVSSLYNILGKWVVF
jgi:DNA-binding XRE family transcriptional regulator